MEGGREVGKVELEDGGKWVRLKYRREGAIVRWKKRRRRR